METPVSVVIALGSNVGDCKGNIEFGVAALQSSPTCGRVTASRIYRGPAHTLAESDEQQDYYNAVAMFKTSLSPSELLTLCLSIEADRGRRRSRDVRWTPRTLDLDIILYGNRTVSEPDLIIPHPELAKRRFVLEPLAEIAPSRHIPAPFDARVQYLLNRCEDSSTLVVVSDDQYPKKPVPGRKS
jgi:2-amino-4-hydroxy-6-hydroxymethyldihydropteridine diphosphokinase